MAAKRRSRTVLVLVMSGLLIAAAFYVFWPRPLMVDMGQVVKTSMTVTINEEAKTRVRDAYIVSAPIVGRLLRVEVEPGDAVEEGISTIARMLPAPPSALDIRTREQARALVSAAEAALRVARADMNKATADIDLADLDLERARHLKKSGTLAQAALDRAEREWRASRASLDTAKAAISMREANLANARARLISFREQPMAGSDPLPTEKAIPLTAPVSGKILRVMQESATTLIAGTPILEIGDISNDLEIVAELLSTDAVQVSPGDRVIIDNWGGTHPLNGTVKRLEPWGFTKFSALGVEEQRVNVIINFTDPPDRRRGLGHGFRVEAQIVVWENEQALTIPSSALFRQNGEWAAFVVIDGRAFVKPVKIGRNNGVQAELLEGLDAGTTLILYPAPGLTDNMRVKQRTAE